MMLLIHFTSLHSTKPPRKTSATGIKTTPTTLYPCKRISLTVTASFGLAELDPVTVIDFIMLTASISPSATQHLMPLIDRSGQYCYDDDNNNKVSDGDDDDDNIDSGDGDDADDDDDDDSDSDDDDERFM